MTKLGENYKTHEKLEKIQKIRKVGENIFFRKMGKWRKNLNLKILKYEEK